MASASHVPPQNIEAEESVLGAMLVAEPSLTRVIDEVKLNAEDFYLEKHAAIFRAAHDLYAASKPVDELSVAEALTQRNEIEEAGGRNYVAELAAKVPAAGNAKHYAEIVQQNSLLRRLLGAGQEIQGWVHERDGEPRELSERAEKLLFEVAHKEQASDFRMLSEILHDEVDRLEKLSTGETELTGTPSGFRDIDSITGGFQPGNLVIVAARPAMGKCLCAQSLIYDPRSGARRTVKELHEEYEPGEDVWVASLSPDLKVKPAKVAAIEENGRKKVFRLTTRLGRWTEATSNHPVLTNSGWKELGEVEPGDRVAVPRRLPRTGRKAEMPDDEIVLLAALIADGSLSQRTPRFCFGSGSAIVDEVERAASAYGVRLNLRGGRKHGTASISGGRGSGPNPVTAMLKAHGLMGLRSAEKFVPDAVFGLSDEQIARFLGVMYSCDGHVYCSERLAQIGYTTISERLAGDVQHLLLRLGIVATIRTLRREVYDGTGKVAREVRITSQGGMRRFCELIRVPGKEGQQKLVLERLDVAPRMTNTDTIPAEIWEDVLLAKGEQPWAAVSELTGRPRNNNWYVGKRSPSRGLLAELAEATRSPALEELADSDIWWDEVASVEYVGEEETYDLDVPGLRNFVADDIIVHNSAIVANIAENVAVKRQTAGRLLLARDVGGRAGAALHRLPGADLRRQAAQGPGRAEGLAEGGAGLQRAGGGAAVVRRFLRPRPARPAGEGAPPARPGPGPGRPRPGDRRLPAADARRRPARQPGRAGGPDEPRPEDPRPRARGAGAGDLPALPRPRAAPPAEADALRPARVGLPDRRLAGPPGP